MTLSAPELASVVVACELNTTSPPATCRLLPESEMPSVAVPLTISSPPLTTAVLADCTASDALASTNRLPPETCADAPCCHESFAAPLTTTEPDVIDTLACAISATVVSASTRLPSATASDAPDESFKLEPPFNNTEPPPIDTDDESAAANDESRNDNEPPTIEKLEPLASCTTAAADATNDPAAMLSCDDDANDCCPPTLTKLPPCKFNWLCCEYTNEPPLSTCTVPSVIASDASTKFELAPAAALVERRPWLPDASITNEPPPIVTVHDEAEKEPLLSTSTLPCVRLTPPPPTIEKPLPSPTVTDPPLIVTVLPLASETVASCTRLMPPPEIESTAPASSSEPCPASCTEPPLNDTTDDWPDTNTSAWSATYKLPPDTIKLDVPLSSNLAC